MRDCEARLPSFICFGVRSVLEAADGREGVRLYRAGRDAPVQEGNP